MRGLDSQERRRMITLASDFGSPYPAAMKGVVLRTSDARLVDVAHDLPRGDVRAAAFWLRFVLPEFPPAVHLVVVDPGVGTDRAAVAIRAGEHVLVGPDNGVLLPIARALARGPGGGRSVAADARADATDDVEAYAIEVDEPASATFHGRDVFAPAAAAVHAAVAGEDRDRNAGSDAGWSPGALAGVDGVEPAASVVDLRFPESVVADGRALAEVLVVDGFGNAITSLPGEALADHDGVVVDDERVPIVDTFAAVDPGRPLVTVGSHGYVELDVNDGRGDDWFDLEPGDTVELRFVR
jgi:hypothetical protein